MGVGRWLSVSAPASRATAPPARTYSAPTEMLKQAPPVSKAYRQLVYTFTQAEEGRKHHFGMPGLSGLSDATVPAGLVLTLGIRQPTASRIRRAKR
ncbi:hypothetical protein CHELA40_50396 [Chelatococcus asaccharovorans]|nr:hypothetical protein CHELA17_20361 [Chelatococcus asaccharovorans]CAH1692664.1 hypothetical protein CHELA40_50396 [Chelatococcus asaccharovorans]